MEKPTEFVSDLAIIGIYYFKDGENLASELQYLIDNDIKDKGEYQLTNALENMKNKGAKFKPGKVDLWMDCGNKNVTVDTNRQVLDLKQNDHLISDDLETKNAIIVPPCYIGKNVKLKNTVIGPHVSVGDGTIIEDSIIKNTIIQKEAKISNANISNSMIGNKAEFEGSALDLSIGDFTQQKM